MPDNVIYGVKPVHEALLSGHCVNRIYFARESRAKGFQDVVDEARTRKVPFDFVPQAKLNDLAGLHDHQGVVAQTSPVEYTELADCLATCGPKATLLVLDHVENPKNLGMMLRTAAASGADGVLIESRGGARLDDTVLRASAGALFHVPVVRCANLGQTLRQLKNDGFWIFGLAAQGDQNLFEINWPDRVVLITGNESKGLRLGIAKICDSLLSIPLARDFDSLNAAIASAIALFQANKDRLGQIETE